MKRNWLKIIFILCLCFVNKVQAQNIKTTSVTSSTQTTPIELVNADVLLYDETTGNTAQRLVGNVQFKHENALLFCDSAYLYDDNKVDAFGKVHIQQGDSTHIYGDSLAYDGNTKLAKLKHNVKLVDSDVTLTTDSMDYDRNTNIAYYKTKGTIINKENTLVSESGYYHSSEHTMYFKKNVVLTNPKYTMTCDTLKYDTSDKIAYFQSPTHIKSKENLIYCENGWYDTESNKAQFNKNAFIKTKNQTLAGDSLYYDRTNGYGKAIKNITVTDSAQKMIITGDLADFYQRNKHTVVTKKALFMQIEGKDTLFLHADTLKHYTTSYADTVKPKVVEVPVKKGKKKKSETKKVVKEEPEDAEEKDRFIYAYHKVKFYKKDMQGMCDSLVYSTTDSLMKMFKVPVLWSEANQLTGDQINIKSFDGKIETLHLTNNAFISEEVDSNMYNQIKGKTMIGYFVKNELSRISVKGNGQTIYYAKEDNDSYIGVNKAECTDLMIYLKESKVDKITFYKKPVATLYPIDKISGDDLFLKDFKWYGAKRPKNRYDVFVWE
ncbi:MAG: OstA-like protein [Bacteroidota bacterium]